METIFIIILIIVFVRMIAFDGLSDDAVINIKITAWLVLLISTMVGAMVMFGFVGGIVGALVWTAIILRTLYNIRVTEHERKVTDDWYDKRMKIKEEEAKKTEPTVRIYEDVRYGRSYK